MSAFGERVEDAKERAEMASTGATATQLFGGPEAEGAGAMSVGTGAVEVGTGAKEIYDGNYVDGGLDMGGGAAEIVEGVADLAGNSKVAGPAAGVAGVFETAKAVREIAKDPYNGDAYVDAMTGAADTVAGFGGGVETPTGQVATAASVGLKTGSAMRKYSNKKAVENNWYGIDPDTGRPRDGTQDATRLGNGVRDWVGDHVGNETIADVAGYTAAIGKGLWNAYTGVPRGVVGSAIGAITGNDTNLVSDESRARMAEMKRAIAERRSRELRERQAMKTVNEANALMFAAKSVVQAQQAAEAAKAQPFVGMYDAHYAGEPEIEPLPAAHRKHARHHRHH